MSLSSQLENIQYSTSPQQAHDTTVKRRRTSSHPSAASPLGSSRPSSSLPTHPSGYPPQSSIYQGQVFGSLEPNTVYSPTSYTNEGSSKNASPLTPGTTNSDHQLYSDQLLCRPSATSATAEMLRSPLEVSSYAYMPGNMGGYPQPAYGAAPAPTTQQYYDSNRNFAGWSRPNSMSMFQFQGLSASPEQSPAMPSKKRRRTSDHQDSERQNKLRVRRSQLPDITGLGPVRTSVTASTPPLTKGLDTDGSVLNGSVDMFSSAAPAPTAASAYMSPPYSNGYSMGSAYSSLAPPPMPISAPQYPLPGRHSPTVQAPLPPAANASVGPTMVHDNRREKPQCWDHGCNGREFSTFSNLLRHQREKSGTAAKSYCPHCGAEFTRTTARNGHMEHGKCKTRRQSLDPKTQATR